eukprot:TRINITY_DN7352_c0_g1_i1.p1 TRINITY_DN7352_c0_g1~~TRINITY_DN7352_c0_g1_i1.p1  ORF type:complete len:390 (-),score=78.48 TRINITY_DN7352_c0_g1_i1:9-1178(-)
MPSDDLFEIAWRIHRISLANAVPSVNDGKSLSTMVCTISHSCVPNAMWQPRAQQRRGKAVSALQDIRATDEVTCSYVDCFLPKQQRLRILHEQYLFRCSCARCVLPYDDMRAFTCPTAACTGCVFALDGEMDDASASMCTSCVLCGATPTAQAARQRGVAEKSACSDLSSVQLLLDQFDSEKTQQQSSAKILELLKALSVDVGTARRSIASGLSGVLSLILTRVDAIIASAIAGGINEQHYVLQQLHCAAEQILDSQGPSLAVVPHALAVVRAQRLMRSAVSHFGGVSQGGAVFKCAHVLRRFQHPDTSALFSAAARVWTVILPREDKDLVESQRLAGQCYVRTVQTKQTCSRCKTALYCSRECQVKAWPAHKQQCGQVGQFMNLLGNK